MHFKDDPISDMHAKKSFNPYMSEAFFWAHKIWSRLLVPSFPSRSRRIQLPRTGVREVTETDFYNCM